MKIEIPEHKKLVYEMTMPIRWGDMDAMGHVNNIMYFRYLETARINWLQTINAVPDPAKEGIVIINAFCNFHKQLEYPGDISIEDVHQRPSPHHVRDMGDDGARRPARRDLRRGRRDHYLGGFPQTKGD